jgi:hypothetical protein
VDCGHEVSLFPIHESFSGQPSYSVYSATLRIHGSDLALDEITRELGVQPTHQHRGGDRRSPTSRPYADDAWHFTAPVPQEAELTEHLRELWRIVEPHVTYLKAGPAIVDVFCGYRSNDGTGGFAVEPDALGIFIALNTPFGVSVIVDNWLGDRLGEPTKH